MTWRDELIRWRKVSDLIQKEAASELGVPIETLRGWECLGKARKRTPPKYVQSLLRGKMRGS